MLHHSTPIGLHLTAVTGRDCDVSSVMRVCTGASAARFGVSICKERDPRDFLRVMVGSKTVLVPLVTVYTKACSELPPMDSSHVSDSYKPSGRRTIHRLCCVRLSIHARRSFETLEMPRGSLLHVTSGAVDDVSNGSRCPHNATYAQRMTHGWVDASSKGIYSCYSLNPTVR